MIRDITLGQYYPSDSVLHKLDARLKTVLTLLYIIVIFTVKNFWGFLILGIFTFGLIFLSGVPVKLFLKSLKPLFMIMLFTSLLNLFFTGGDVIWQYGFLKITVQGIRMSVFMLLRIIFLVSGSSFLMFTTSPVMLTGAIEALMKPLNKIKIPAHEISMMISIALRFIPTLIEETEKIMMAQKARGAALTEGGFLKRAKALIPVLIPLFISAFRRADELAVAMESRCYNGNANRTKLKEPKMCKRDYIAFVVFIFGAITVFMARYL